MTKDEWKPIAEYLARTYGHKEKGFLDSPEKVNDWYFVLKEYDKDVVQVACVKYVSTEAWSPMPSQILKLCQSEITEKPKTASQAWRYVLDLCGKYGEHGYVRAYAEMGSTLESVLRGSVGGFCELCRKNIERDEKELFNRFRNDYEKVYGEAEAEAVVPKSIKAISAGIAQKRLQEIVGIGVNHE